MHNHRYQSFPARPNVRTTDLPAGSCYQVTIAYQKKWSCEGSIVFAFICSDTSTWYQVPVTRIQHQGLVLFLLYCTVACCQVPAPGIGTVFTLLYRCQEYHVSDIRHLDKSTGTGTGNRIYGTGILVPGTRYSTG